MTPHASVPLLLVLAAACAQAPSGAVAFHRDGAIVLLDVATGDEQVLVADNTYDRPLHWLPGGERLIYWNHDGGAWDLWSVDPDTGTRQNLTGTARDNRSASSSPDGRLIAFHEADGLCVMNADGGGKRVLDARGHRDDPPVWSPSGRTIAFDDLETVGDDSVAMVVHVVRLVDGAVAASERVGHGEVAFFLDEQQLVVHGALDGQSELVVVDLGTGERRALTRGPAADYRATLSPDGRLIAWIEAGEPTDRLKVMDRDGSGARALADVDHWFAGPSFSPDGRYLVFESGTERRETEVYVVATAGGEVRALTRDGGCFPVWRPR